MDAKVIGITAALASSASWAIGSILFKRLGESISPLAMTLAKGSVSVILLGLTLSITGYSGVNRESLVLLIISGLLGISLGDTFFFEALQNLGPHALVILLMLGEVITAMLAVIFLGEMPTPTVWLGIFLVILGVAIVIFPKLSGEQQASSTRGIIFGLLSVLCMSVSIIFAKQGLSSLSTIQATFIRMAAGTAGMLCFGTLTNRLGSWAVPFKDRNIIYLFIISVSIVTFGGFWLSLVAIKYVNVAVANTLNSIEPLFVMPLAAIFLKEKFSTQALWGTIVTTFGIVLICTQ
ncbi:DMT family transporter [Calothrix sp. 336/3]|uniref:DMT family transporter n=1 Tax=Calothrix sp. 336/3 TaxID=1337936 RepID=UPI0004E2DECC|nr:DMT family transporter [Calothrix sp. 336/3]AKG22936.1 hypothetical protein IJ00_18115 [Calothrix sp. 336/3]